MTTRQNIRFQKTEWSKRHCGSFFFEEKRKEFSEGFRRAAKDPEVVELAEMGMDDYFAIIEKFEREEE